MLGPEEKEMLTSGKVDSRACHLGVCSVIQSPHPTPRKDISYCIPKTPEPSCLP